VRNVSSAQKRVTVANANSTTAGLRPPLLRMCVSASQKTLFFRQTNAVPCTRSGGRKPPVQYLPHANSKRANSPHCRCRRSLQPTAGLRPPLLRMCVSASRMALYAANTRRATKSGWREPAVGSITSLQLENARFCQHPCVPTRAAGAGQPWYGKRMCGAKRKQCAKAGHRCKREFDPRRADARRSCECAFLHRKRRCSSGRRTPFHAPGAGGRKPPVQYLPHANSKRANSPHCRRRRGLQPTAG
jgi:hypothetical protein